MLSLSGHRKYKRVRYNLPVGCLGPFAVFEGRTENLSEDGACLLVRRSVEEGTLLSIILRLPTRLEPLVVCSRVLWSIQDESRNLIKCGLQYLWLSPCDREALHLFLQVLKDENED